MIDPVPELFGAERLFADGRQFRDQFFPGQANQVSAAIRQGDAGWIEQRGFGEDAVALAGCQVQDGVGHQRVGGQALTMAA